jgi:predicted metal-dependent hydrolase
MEILRRDVDFGLDADRVPRDWCSSDAFSTTFMNALSLLFPEGERFFVESVKQHRDRITDGELLAAITGFIGQEAMHGREHRALNELIVAHGYIDAPAIDCGVRDGLERAKRVLSPASQLAVTCALEHFTAMLAEALLSDARMRGELHPEVQQLWLWHALEESEHKAVAFDVYTAAGGGYLRRVAIMLVTTAAFFAAHAHVQTLLLQRRGILTRPWRWLHGVTRMWVYPGYFTRLLPAYLHYFAPGFHPSHRDTTALLEVWRQRLAPLWRVN